MVNITRPIFCHRCGESFTAYGNGARYCPDCRAIVRREQSIELDQIKRESNPRPRPTKDKYIITSYTPELIDFNDELELIALKGRLLSPEMLEDMLDTLPPGVHIQYNEQHFISDEYGQLLPLTA